MNINLTHKTTVLAANETQAVAVTGNKFHCKTSTTTFRMSVDGGEFIDMEQGWGFDTGDEPFKMLIFTNETAAPLAITYYAGTEQLSYSAPIGLLQVTVKSQSTYTKGSGIIALAGAGSQTFNGLDGANVRKQIVVTNMDAANDLYVKDNGNNIVGTVFPRTAWTMETNGVLKIVNPNVGAMNVIVGETFYV